MRKGVILEINDLYLTLLTPEGEFLRTRKLQQDYQVGEEIHFFPEMLANKRRKFNLSFLNSFKSRTIALTAALMLAMTAFLPVYQSGQVYAYMSIDVNPSIELALSDELKVLRLKGYNPEGKEIIEEIEGWKKKDAAEVAEMILDKIEDKGFFNQKNDIVIATVHNDKVKEAVDQKLDEKISEIKKATQEENLELKVMQGTTEDREKAKKQGLTTGVFKEKQSEKGKPVSNPVKQQQKPKQEDAQRKPETPKPNPDQTQKMVPKEQDVPGQIKKNVPEPKKGEPGKSTPAPDVNKGSDKKDHQKSNKDNTHRGQGNINDDDQGQTYANISRNDQGQKARSKKSSNKKQRPNEGPRVQAGHQNDKHNKK